jgi:hypothetical protein
MKNGLTLNEQDHDQRFKTLIQEFFADFMSLFFAKWAERLDCAAAEWLPQEVFPDPPDGPRRVLDLVAQLPTRKPILSGPEGDKWLALVHIEIESPDRAAPLRARMHRYHGDLRDKYGIPVLPIGIFLRVGLDGVGIDSYTDTFWELEVVRFQYLYVGLPGLDGVQYVQGDNWLGVALSALMRIPADRVAWLGAEALRRLTEAPLTERKKFLLGECVQAYLPMDERQRQEYEELLKAEPYSGVAAVNKTVYEKGIEKGIEKGRRDALRDQIDERFGPLSQGLLERLETISLDQVRSITRVLSQAKSLKDLGLSDN